MDELFESKNQKFNTLTILEKKSISEENWNDLKLFLSLARAGSINAAASQVSVSRQTLSRALKRLETLYGTQLYDAIEPQNGLTDAGLALARKVNTANETFLEISPRIQNGTLNESSPLKVCITDGLPSAFVIPKLAEAPTSIKTRGINFLNVSTVNSMTARCCDVLISGSNYPESHWSNILLKPLWYRPYCSQSYLDKYGIPETGSLQKHIFLRSDLYHPQSRIWKPWQDLVVKGRSPYCIDSPTAYFSAVYNGIGIGLLGDHVKRLPKLEAVLTDLKISVPIYIHLQNNTKNDPAAKELQSWIAFQFERTSKNSTEMLSSIAHVL